KMRSNSIIFMLLVFIGFLTAAAESNAQVVPPRSQTLQMIRPTTPPPVPPLQREIRELKQEVQATTPIPYYGGQLACYQECRIRGGKICGGPIPPGAEQNPLRFCELRAEALRHQIADIEARLAK